MLFGNFQVSNVIYLDSPAGVGYSYSKNTEDYNTGDLKTATDAHTFLLKVHLTVDGVIRMFSLANSNF